MRHLATTAALPPRYRTAPSILVVLSVILAAGCSEDAVVCPEDPVAPWGSPSDLQTLFFVEPSMVEPGDTLEARLSILNPTSCTITLFGGSSCVAQLRVFRGHEQVVMEWTGWGCFGPPPDGFPVEARDSLVRVYRFVAKVAGHPPAHWVLAPPGVYTLVADMQVQLPDLQDDFLVVE